MAPGALEEYLGSTVVVLRAVKRRGAEGVPP